MTILIFLCHVCMSRNLNASEFGHFGRVAYCKNSVDARIVSIFCVYFRCHEPNQKMTSTGTARNLKRSHLMMKTMSFHG